MKGVVLDCYTHENQSQQYFKLDATNETLKKNVYHRITNMAKV